MNGRRARMLLRVSSNQQLEADGDLTVQRNLVMEYVSRQRDKGWILDEKEYFEGSNSGYSNSVANRRILTEIMEDAKKREFDILVVYKDDRVGRRMWEMGAFIMQLKGYGVDVYTAKDGCISPEQDDIMGQMVLALRYGSAQKSSADTGMRVRDTAREQVRKGKFPGGRAGYGYELIYSGEISKHGRALRKRRILPEQAEVVQYIYRLSAYQDYGSGKIAKMLNKDDYYHSLAPCGDWKAGMITDILKNPVYAGYESYNRRQRIQGEIRRLSSENWIISNHPNPEIQIVSEELWEDVQEKRMLRRKIYERKSDGTAATIISRNYGSLVLIDVAYCGYCGSRLLNGSKYNYWTIKSTGERRKSKIPIYQCRHAGQDMLHDGSGDFRADRIEPAIFFVISECLGFMRQEMIVREMEDRKNSEKKIIKRELKKLEKELEKLQAGTEIMLNNIPEAMCGEYEVPLADLWKEIADRREKEKEQKKYYQQQKEVLKRLIAEQKEKGKDRVKIPDWQKLFWQSSQETKRVIVRKLIGRVEVKKGELKIRFQIGKNDFEW